MANRIDLSVPTLSGAGATDTFIQCLLEEYRQCKTEVIALQKYQWRAQMFYIPSLILMFLGFYLREVWGADDRTAISFSGVVGRLFSDPAFVVLVFWSAVVTLLIFLFTGSMMFREAHHINARISPRIEALTGAGPVFYWERLSAERWPGSTRTDDVLLASINVFGTLLLLLPISIAVVCIIKGAVLLGSMAPIIVACYWAGVVASFVCLVAGVGAIIALEIRARSGRKENGPNTGQKGRDTEEE